MSDCRGGLPKNRGVHEHNSQDACHKGEASSACGVDEADRCLRLRTTVENPLAVLSRHNRHGVEAPSFGLTLPRHGLARVRPGTARTRGTGLRWTLHQSRSLSVCLWSTGSRPVCCSSEQEQQAEIAATRRKAVRIYLRFCAAAAYACSPGTMIPSKNQSLSTQQRKRR